MSVEPYPVVRVEQAWSVDQEQMGTKQKFWYLPPQGGPPWLFKYPRPGTGEHWAEKIAAEIAAYLGIPHARVELAQLEDIRASASESFLLSNEGLIHGNDLMFAGTAGYDPKKRRQQSQHTLERILDSLTWGNAPEWAIKRFCDYLLLDALITNTDRHHENWGLKVQYKPVEGTEIFKVGLAPTFDHASSLGRELLDTSRKQNCRQKLMQNGRVGDYAERASGGIYWLGNENKAPSPLQLMRLAVQKSPDLFRPALASLEKLNPQKIDLIIQRIPQGWMTPLARQFALKLVCYNLKELEALANG